MARPLEKQTWTGASGTYGMNGCLPPKSYFCHETWPKKYDYQALSKLIPPVS